MINIEGDQLFFLVIVGIIFLLAMQGLIKSIRLVPARQEFLVERLGKYNTTLKAGFHLLIPFIDKVAFQQNLKEQTIDVPSQQCFTKDEIQVEVDGVIYMQVSNSVKASYGITNYKFASIQLAQTTTRAIVGTLELDRTFEEREAISKKVVEVLDDAASKWGVRILRFEIKNLTPPNSVRQSMEKQVTAERDRRAILKRSEGERQSLINTSEGIKQEMINESEGEMQKRINEAEGYANEIISIGEATAESIKLLARAIDGPGGYEAIKLQMGEKYFKAITNLQDPKNRVIVSGNIINMDDMLKELDLDL